MKYRQNHLTRPFVVVAISLGLLGCSSSAYKTQSYAKLSNAKMFEDEYEKVWKAIVSAFNEYKVDEKEKDKGGLTTDWVYSTSNDKYVEYHANGFPRKKYLQTRYKFSVRAEKQIGGVKVTVNTEEDIENLKSDGSFDNWKSVSESDTSRQNEMLRNIELKILSQ